MAFPKSIAAERVSMLCGPKSLGDRAFQQVSQLVEFEIGGLRFLRGLRIEVLTRSPSPARIMRENQRFTVDLAHVGHHHGKAVFFNGFSPHYHHTVSR